MNIRVRIWNRDLGYAYWDSSRQVCIFEYEPSFVDSGLEVSPIMMPLAKGRVYDFPGLGRDTFLGLPPMLADSLPDDFGNHLMKNWLARQGIRLDALLPVERLSYVGKRGMGALEFEPEKLGDKLSDSQVNIHDLVEVANRVLDEKKRTAFGSLDKGDLMQIIRLGTSAGGARAKAILALDEENQVYKPGDLLYSGRHSYWLLKLDGVSNRALGDPEGYGKIEHAYYRMACDCGIHMMDSRLIHEGERSHFMTQRFDRAKHAKIHLQTLGGLAGMDYRQPDSYSYEQVFSLMRKMQLPHSDMEQMFRRMGFNLLARNQDDHVKNISLLMDEQGKWVLSPAYDLSYAYNPGGIWTGSHQLSVNGKREHFQKEDLLKIGKENHIASRLAIVEQMTEVISQWENYARESYVDKATAMKIGKMHRTF